jgi:UDP-N-acetylmuramate--alanine ligase
MNLAEIKSVYFLGIGGIGMSALARYFNQQGIRVSGYDKTPTLLTAALESEGIKISFTDTEETTPINVELVIYTPAIPKDHIGFNLYKSNGQKMLKRAEVLGLLSKNHFAICVAGSHGKTTVSAMIAHILTHSGLGCTAFLGGIASNYNTNYLSPNINATRNDVMVIEADEFDRSFLHLSPDIAVITAVDTDHLDIYGSKEKIDEAFIEFTKKIDEEGFLVIKENQSIESGLPFLDKAFYSLSSPSSDIYCSKYWVVDGGYMFTLSYYGKESMGFRLNIGGYHNIENAIAAICVLKEMGLSNSQIKEGLASFKGIKRRFERVFDDGNVIYIDDYAHHPAEIDVLIQSVIELYPNKKITALFQPHLFSRTKDLADGFAKALSAADTLYLLDIYPARELPVVGVTSDLILSKVASNRKSIITKEEFLAKIKDIDNGVILTIGAGDIDTLVQPIANSLQQEAVKR